MSNQQTVVVVDDDEGVRDAMGMLLDTVGLSSQLYGSAQEFLDHLSEVSGGCLLLDIRMPGMSGLELLTELKKRALNLPVIFMTGHGDVAMAVDAMRLGALDFIQKPFREQELLDRIHEALAFDADNSEIREQRAELMARLNSLSARERQVFELVADGHANKVIAFDLSISERTVEVHRSQAMKKMKARTLADLVRIRLESQRLL